MINFFKRSISIHFNKEKSIFVKDAMNQSGYYWHKVFNSESTQLSSLKQIELPDGYFNIYKYLEKFPNERKKYDNDMDLCFIKKYRNNISQGHYGFAIGSPIKMEWLKLIEEVLDFLILNDPDVGIHQSKMKYGGIRFYCESKVIKDLFEIENLITDTLFDESLIY